MRHDTPRSPQASSLSNRNGAETTTFRVTTPRAHCKRRHLRIDVVPKLIFFASRHPYCKGRHLQIEMVPKLLLLASPRAASTVKVVTVWRHDVEIVPKLLLLEPRHPASRGSSLMHRNPKPQREHRHGSHGNLDCHPPSALKLTRFK